MSYMCTYNYVSNMHMYVHVNSVHMYVHVNDVHVYTRAHVPRRHRDGAVAVFELEMTTATIRSHISGPVLHDTTWWDVFMRFHSSFFALELYNMPNHVKLYFKKFTCSLAISVTHLKWKLNTWGKAGALYRKMIIPVLPIYKNTPCLYNMIQMNRNNL